MINIYLLRNDDQISSIQMYQACLNFAIFFCSYGLIMKRAW